MNGIVCVDAWDLVYSGQTDGQSSLKMQYTVVPVSLKIQQTNKQTNYTVTSYPQFHCSSSCYLKDTYACC